MEFKDYLSTKEICQELNRNQWVISGDHYWKNIGDYQIAFHNKLSGESFLGKIFFAGAWIKDNHELARVTN